jgi:hypothetical protein
MSEIVSQHQINGIVQYSTVQYSTVQRRMFTEISGYNIGFENIVKY